MSRSAVVVAAGKSFNPQLLPRVWELGDVLAINYCAYPIMDAGLKPAYYLTWDRPDRFCLEFHQDPAVRSIICSAYEHIAVKKKFSNWIGVSLTDKIEPDVNPFTRPTFCRPWKSICVAAQYLVRANYSTVYFWGTDFLPDQEKWYAVSTAPLNDQVFKSKCASQDEQFDCLRRWSRHTGSMGCKWISLSPISKLNECMEYRPLA